jgi:glucokinase
MPAGTEEGEAIPGSPGRRGGDEWADRPRGPGIRFARIGTHPLQIQPRGFSLSARPVLALDVGGTHIRTAVVLDDGSRAAVARGRTPVARGPAAVIDACEGALKKSLDGVAPEIRKGILGIGISSPGPVNPWRGVVVETPNMGPEFKNVPLADELCRRLGLPAFLERDTNVAALGEMAFGAARGVADFIYLTVSTGVGGAIVSEGRIFHGPDGTAGELGHMPVAMEGAVCGCGGVGHLEAFMGGANIARMARAAATAGTSPFLAERAATKGLDCLEARDVAEGEDAGDDACRQIMERGRRAFAVACVGFVDALNPSRIVVGGAIADAQGERLLGPARAEVAATAFRTPRSRVQIVHAELGGDVGLAGAHPLVIARLGDPAWQCGPLDPGAVERVTL